MSVRTLTAAVNFPFTINTSRHGHFFCACPVILSITLISNVDKVFDFIDNEAVVDNEDEEEESLDEQFGESLTTVKSVLH